MVLAAKDVCSAFFSIIIAATVVGARCRDTICVINDGSRTNNNGNCFSRSKSFTTLHCYRLNYIPKFQNDHSATITSAFMQDNNWSNIPGNFFTNLPNLVALNMTNNGIQSFAEGALNPLLKLENLDLSDNSIRSIPQNLLGSNLRNLFHLSLRGNSIAELEANRFSQLRKVKELYLDENKIKQAHKDAFDGMAMLLVLSLSGNEIENIHKETFQSLSTMTKLCIDRNKLTVIQNDTFKNQKFMLLNLSYNDITSIYSKAFSDKTIETLDLRANNRLDCTAFNNLNINVNMLHLPEQSTLCTTKKIPTTAKDICISNPCRNGTCVSNETHFECYCVRGFEGKNCSQDIDECKSNPCKNEGTCKGSVQGIYTCACPPGWFGTTCEIEDVTASRVAQSINRYVVGISCVVLFLSLITYLMLFRKKKVPNAEDLDGLGNLAAQTTQKRQGKRSTRRSTKSRSRSRSRSKSGRLSRNSSKSVSDKKLHSKSKSKSKSILPNPKQRH